ncbi:hypothetical protein AB0302_04430 [Micrococcus sp. NPDC078436]|uniref:hypothetical protein n=1 Tax=Micrococcus sp. NPDC078436 TaxID=3154960 RepID=UPI00344C742B
MTTLILDWSDWDGAASGWASLTRVTWRRDPDTYQVPWTRQVRVDGRTIVDVQGMAGEALRVRWTPDGGGSRTDHVLVPDEGEHLAHLLERVDPSTLEPLPESMPSAVDLVARAESLVTRIESGEFAGADGADGDDGRGITSVEMVGASARFTWTDGTTQDVDLSALAGDDGDDGVGVESVTLDGTTLQFSLSDGTARDVDAAALRGKDGRTPDLAWDGTRLVVDGVPGPDLKGEAGEDGHTPAPTWQGTALSWDGGEPVDLRGASGQTPTIKIGTVTSGTTPSATITGTSPDLTLDLVLAKGDKGDAVAMGLPDTGWRRIATTIPGVSAVAGLDVRAIGKIIYARLQPVSTTNGLTLGATQTKAIVPNATLPTEWRTPGRMTAPGYGDSGMDVLMMMRDGQFWLTILTPNIGYVAWNASWVAPNDPHAVMPPGVLV